MKKKLLSLALVVALVAIMVGGTLAYFTDTDKVTNTFTLGNVKIQIFENGNPTSTPYEDFTKNPLVPGTWINKVVHVENIGANTAYIRTHIGIPTALVTYLELQYVDLTNSKWSLVDEYTGFEDGVPYTYYYFDYADPVSKDGETVALLQAVRLAEDVDLEPIGSEGEMEFVKKTNGAITANSGFKAHVKNNEGEIVSAAINVVVFSQAVQADGFNSATEALDAGFPVNS